jgi:hypothetical protein
MSAKEYFEKQYQAAVERQRLYESRGLIEPGDSWIGLDMKLFLDTNAPTAQPTPPVATPPPAEAKPPSPFRRFFTPQSTQQPKTSKNEVRIEMKPPSPRLKAFTENKGCSF